MLSIAPLCGSLRYILRLLRHLEMISPSVGSDIEAQINTVTETRSAITPDPPPTTNTANPHLPTTADPQPQATNTNEHHNGSALAQQTADNSQVQRGILTFPFHKL